MKRSRITVNFFRVTVKSFALIKIKTIEENRMQWPKFSKVTMKFVKGIIDGLWVSSDTLKDNYTTYNPNSELAAVLLDSLG